MRVIVTRPSREAQGWVKALAAAGHDALALPLITIAAAPDTAVVQEAWRQLAGYLGLMFVSANAVDGFFAARPPDAPLPRQAWATGPGTVHALERAGLPASCITAPAADAPQFDSEALWALLTGRIAPGARVLIVRGADSAEGSTQGAGRDWFASQVGAAGAKVDFVASYQRLCPQLDAAQLRLAQAAASDGSVWLFSSSEAVHNLRVNLPQQDWQATRAVATHARIAQAARAAGFGVVRESRPALADVRASIESMA